jgi:hypothetical protein
MTDSIIPHNKQYPEYTRTFAEVYLAELDYIKKRRDKINIPSEDVMKECERVCKELDWKEETNDQEISSHSKIKPSTKANLVGLALSGGGVRSATFNLGLLQALAKNKVLQYCDYLSTVSGGGYIGSCLSSLLANEHNAEENSKVSTKPDEFPLRDQRKEGEEPKEVNHLRATKNYLCLDTSVFNLANLHLIGLNISAKLLLNTVAFAFIILFTLFLYWLEPSFYGEDSKVSVSAIAWQIAVIVAMIATLIVVIIRWGQASILFGGDSYKSHQKFDSQITFWTVITLITVIVGVVAFLFNFIYTQAWDGIVGKTDSFFDFHDVVIFLLVASIAVILGKRFSLYKNSTQTKLLQVLLSIALITLLITLPIGLLSVVYKVESQYQISHLTNETCDDLHSTQKNKCMEFLKNLYFIEADGFIHRILEKLNNSANKIDFSSVDQHRLIEVVTDLHNHNEIRQYIIGVMLFFSALLLLIGLFTNINYNSLHYFYRNRLSNTFLIRRFKGEIKSNHSLLLKNLYQRHNGPYHLINTTLNVPRSKNRSLHERGADFFIFSKFYCGAKSTGYRCTDSYNNGQTKLATAMAISGAAASPEMGKGTNPFLRLAMTLLNYRLHQWLPNPKFNRQLRVWGPSYLFKELFGFSTENDVLINLSDGGHHENLGIYPLLERRCKLIIASDAGADPDYRMEDFANLQCKARIDLGIEIEIDLEPLRPKPNPKAKTALETDCKDEEEKNTSAYFVKAMITYADGTKGTLFYIKTTMTGTEPEQLLAYRRQHPTFPDETTADQFFNEDQFESYRKLGEWIGERFYFETVVKDKTKDKMIETIFTIDTQNVKAIVESLHLNDLENIIVKMKNPVTFYPQRKEEAGLGEPFLNLVQKFVTEDRSHLVETIREWLMRKNHQHLLWFAGEVTGYFKLSELRDELQPFCQIMDEPDKERYDWELSCLWAYSRFNDYKQIHELLHKTTNAKTQEWLLTVYTQMVTTHPEEGKHQCFINEVNKFLGNQEIKKDVRTKAQNVVEQLENSLTTLKTVETES